MPNPRGTPQNLRRLPKGVSGNPGGRPKGTSLTAALRAELDKPCAAGSPMTKREALVEKLVSLALTGDLAAIREVLDRTEGKVVARRETEEAGDVDELRGLSIAELRAALGVANGPMGAG